MKKFIISILMILSLASFIFSQTDNVATQENSTVLPAQIQAQTQTQAQTPIKNKVKTDKPAEKVEKIDALVEYRNGKNLKNAGKTEEAKAAFKRSIDVCYAELKEKPNNIESYVVLTWSLLGNENYPECINECKKALRIYSKETRIIETLAEAYFYNRQYELSIRYFEQYIENLPNGERVPTVYFFMGEAYRILHQWEHADIAYSEAVRRQNWVPLWWYRLGQVKEKAGDVEGAKKAYQQTLKLSPNYPDATAALNRL